MFNLDHASTSLIDKINLLLNEPICALRHIVGRSNGVLTKYVQYKDSHLWDLLRGNIITVSTVQNNHFSMQITEDESLALFYESCRGRHGAIITDIWDHN